MQPLAILYEMQPLVIAHEMQRPVIEYGKVERLPEQPVFENEMEEQSEIEGMTENEPYSKPCFRSSHALLFGNDLHNFIVIITRLED